MSEPRCCEQNCHEPVCVAVSVRGVTIAYACVASHLRPIMYATAHLGASRTVVTPDEAKAMEAH